MSDFNWNDQPLADQGSTFNWEDHPVDKSATLVADQANPSSALSAFGSGALRGASFNLSQRGEAAAKSAMGESDYETLLKDIRQRDRQTDAEHPYASAAGKLAGGVGSVLLGGELLGALGVGGEAAAGAALETAPIAESVGTTAVKAGLGEGTTTAQQLFPRLSQVKSLEGTLNAMKTGTALGAVSGLGGAEDWTNIPETLKETGEGAIGGGVGAGMLHGAGKAISSILGGAGKAISTTPLAKEFKRGFNVGARGTADIADTKGSLEALHGAATSAVDKINIFDNKIQQGYNNLLDQSGAGIEIDPNNISSVFDSIAKPIQEIAGDAYDQQLNKVQKILAQLTGAGESATEAQPISPRRLKATIDELQKMADTAYDPVTKSGNDPALYRVASSARDKMKELLVNSLGQEADQTGKNLGKQYLELDQQFKKLIDLKNELGIKGKVGSQSPNLAVQQATQDAAEGLSKDLVRSTSGNDDASIRLDRLFSKLDDVQNSTLSPEEAQAMGTSEDIAGQLKNKAEDYYSAQSSGKNSMFNSGNKFLLSPRAAATRMGMATGKAVGVAGDIATAPIAAAKDISDLVTSRSQAAANIADTLSKSVDNPNAQKAGEMMKKVLMEPDVGYRRALMFSLGQQSWFRSAVSKHVLDFNNENGGE